jgi:hypothetical protein
VRTVCALEITLSAISPQSGPGQTPEQRTSPAAAPEGLDPAVAGGPDAVAAAREFRPYRRFVYLVAMTVIFVGVGYLLMSVAVTIYRQRHTLRATDPIDPALDRGELLGCARELSDVSVALQKHLEQSHYLLSGYDQVEAQRWASEGDIWRNRMKVLGERCRFGHPVRTPTPPEFDELGAAYREMADTEKVYTKELLRFGKEQAPRLDRLNSRINRIEERLAKP